MKKIKFLLVLIVSIILLSPQGFAWGIAAEETASNGSVMAVFAKYEGIDGESRDRDHDGWLNVVLYEHKKAGPNRRLEIMNVTVRKDKSAPALASAFREKKVFSTVKIDDVSSPGNYMRYELKNVMITSMHGTRNLNRTDMVLNFEEIKVTYNERASSGRTKSTLRYSWKVEKGESD